MADDLGYGDLGCFGQQTIRTPRLDELARDGMRLTSFYAGCTVCRPSRLVLWTGQHTGHTAISDKSDYVFRPSEVTVAELLHDAGYATGGVGKWAMGDTTNAGHPNDNGFDFWMGYLDQSQAHNYYPTHLWRNRVRYPLAGNVLFDDPAASGRVAERRETYSHDVATEQALEFIRSHHDQPFLLHVHWTIPHANNEAGSFRGDGMEVPDDGPYADRDWPSTAKGAAAMISRMDADVGRIRELLESLGIQRRTLLIFTSDNGPHSEGGHSHEFFDSNGPLRGFKRDLYEGGIRVPTIAWWPGTVDPGTVSDTPLAFWDFLPTACELAGAEAPQNIDGISFAELLRGGDVSDRPDLYWQFQGKRAVRMGNWKAVRPGADQPWELYDLESDIGERNDVAAGHPDVVRRAEAYTAAARQ
jgi:uncharacterized sulfatase